MRSATTSRVRSSSVGPSPPVRISRSRSAERVRHDRLSATSRSSPAIAFPLQVDAELVQPLGDEQRVRVDMRGRQHLAADGDHFSASHDNHPARGSKRREAAGSRRSRPSRRQPSHRSRHAAVRAAGPETAWSRRARETAKTPEATPAHPTGIMNRVMSMPITSSITIGPRIDASQIFLARPRQYDTRRPASRRSASARYRASPRSVRPAYTATPAAEPTVPGANGKKPMYPKLQTKTARRRMVGVRWTRGARRGCGRGDRAARGDRR